MARKVPKSLISWLMPKLRRMSLYWPSKAIARDKTKVYEQIGTYNNGKPKFIARYTCHKCLELGINKLHAYEDTAMDHIKPVVDVAGFDGDWTKLIENLFCDESGYQTLCHKHHLEKSESENKQRRIIKKTDKPNKPKNIKKLSKLTLKSKKRLTSKSK